MQEYKNKIYQLWTEKDVSTYPGSEDFISQRTKEYEEYIIKKFFNLKNKSLKILDLGCGRGIFLKACVEEGFKNLFGVDIAKGNIDFIKQKFGISSVYCQDILDFLKISPDNSFDIICAFDVMEHFTKEDILEIFRLIYKKLKHKGMFLMQVPNGGSLSGIYIFNSDLTHDIAFTDMLIKELFTLSGFEKISVSGRRVKKGLIRIFLNTGRKIISKLMGFENEFMFFTELIGIGYKN